MRIYCDGIFDLFHAGHIETLKYIKNMEDGVKVIIGIISDENAKNYKRLPIINQKNRQIMLESCIYVDEVIPDSPMIITQEFIDKHKIDLIVHSFSDEKDVQKQNKYFEIVKNLNKFKVIPYSTLDSTSNIISRINKNY